MIVVTCNNLKAFTSIVLRRIQQRIDQLQRDKRQVPIREVPIMTRFLP